MPSDPEIAGSLQLLRAVSGGHEASNAPKEKIELARLRAGDEKAFLELYDLYGAAVRRLIGKLTFSESEVEDLLQETFLEIFRSAHKQSVDARLQAWVFGVAYNVVRRHQRARFRFWRVFERNTPVEQAPEPSSNDNPNEFNTDIQLRTALSRLELEERTLLVLRFFEDWTIAEIADTLAISEATVKRRLNAAKLKLCDEVLRFPDLAHRIAVMSHSTAGAE